MREGLKEKTVLAMYDIRGIQSYIFNSNRIRDIIGASELVENIIWNGLNEICSSQGWDRNTYLLDWENDENIVFLNDESVQMQVLFVGGGNAYVLFRTGELCECVNRALAKYVLEHTYSLNLAVAVVEKTEDYSLDYKNINQQIREVKAVMPQVRPMGAFPFMPIDSATGYPLASYDYGAGEYISTESGLKREYWKKNKDEEPSKILDNMVTKKGDSSMLAVVHIDGNGMGSRIKEIMQDQKSYADAVRTMRKISYNLKYEFFDCYKQMCEKIDENIAQRVKQDSKGKLYRKIIVAGDDITFICNAKIALYAVKEFLNAVSGKIMYSNDKLSTFENQRRYAMSACAGVAFFNSHFPFRDAYEVAESCCSSAKRIAKMAEHRADGMVDGMIGNYVDFQICHHIKAADLGSYREKQYLMPDGEWMVYRPYYVYGKAYEGVFDLNERKENKEREIEQVLFHNLQIFQREGIGQSKYKKLRNTFSYGSDEVEKEIVFIKSREVKLPETEPMTWYDALEIVSVCELGGETS